MTDHGATGSEKRAVREYWNETPCGTQFGQSDRFTRAYFEEIERHRYEVAPEIFSFAQFTRANQLDVLEVGVGAGTDFAQWVRAGARATGVDLTENGAETTRRRLEAYGLEPANIVIADAEHLPFAADTFDLVYSWGVIHHTPDTPAALAEILRVCRPGGNVKVMLYNRHSLATYWLWAKTALRSGRPDRSLAWVLANYMESPGTKGYTCKEATAMLRSLGVEHMSVTTRLSYYDVDYVHRPLVRVIARLAARLLGDRVGWWLLIDAHKPGATCDTVENGAGE